MEKAQKGDLIRIIPHEGNGYIGKFYEVGDVFEVFRRDDDDGILIESKRADYGDGDKKLYVYDEEYVIHRKAGEEDSPSTVGDVIANLDKLRADVAVASIGFTAQEDYEESDAVNSPNHYTQGKFETIEIIEDAVIGADPFEAVCQANILKYTLRYRFKNGVEDLKKARWYLDRLIAAKEGASLDE